MFLAIRASCSLAVRAMRACAQGESGGTCPLRGVLGGLRPGFGGPQASQFYTSPNLKRTFYAFCRGLQYLESSCWRRSQEEGHPSPVFMRVVWIWGASVNFVFRTYGFPKDIRNVVSRTLSTTIPSNCFMVPSF